MADAEPRTPAVPTGDIARHVAATPFIDTHEHLVEESARVHLRPGGPLPCDDWALLFSHYLNSDLAVAGMPPGDQQRLLSQDVSSDEKWKLLEPWWPAVRNTGYGRATAIAIEKLYGVKELSARTIRRVEAAYHEHVKPGFYRSTLCGAAGIESCQVNSLERTFMETEQPDLLMQDLSILGMHMGPNWRAEAGPSGLKVNDLADYHRSVDWWFEKYGRKAVAVKSQAAYGRGLDYQDVPAEKAEAPFRALLNGDPVPHADRKAVEDHLFWYCVRKATEYRLPVKLHTGYYAGHGGMPLARVRNNPSEACELLQRGRDATFVFMHIGYPYQDEMIAVAKHYPNAVIDMCWAWIISPVASMRFLEEFLTTAPANKILTFGGDYIPVEPVVGHAAIARQGITQALTHLVEQGWLTRSAAVELVPMLMNGNARRIFHLADKA